MELLQKHIAELLILVFLIITFLQSGFEKVSDWGGNISFIKDHFKDSPLKNYVPFLLMVILVMEIIAGGFMFVGIFQLLLVGETKQALLGVELCAVILLFLLVGQRLAKDYVGAMSLTVYFILTIFGIYLLNN